MILRILLGLLRNEQAQVFLMVIDYLCKENKILRDKHAETGRRFRFLPVGEKCLRHIIREYLQHYHSERNHQGEDIGNVLLFPDERMQGAPNGRIIRHSRLGGLLNFYHRAAGKSGTPGRGEEERVA